MYFELTATIWKYFLEDLHKCEQVRKSCVRYKTEWKRLTKIKHGFDKDGNEIYTKTITYSWFSRTVHEEFDYSSLPILSM